MLKLFSRNLLVLGVALGACGVSVDAAAETTQHFIVVTLSFQGTRIQGMSTGVNIVETGVNGALQYRVNVLTNLAGKPGACTVAVASSADASWLKNELLDAHATAVTCAVSHAVTTDPTLGTFVFLNLLSPAAGDTLTIESR